MQYLSLHIIFSIKVDIRQYQECIQNGQNMNFDFFAPEFGALPILQDCPSGLMIQCQNLTRGESNEKNIDQKRDNIPPVKIVGIHSGLMIQCQNLAGGSQMKKNIDQNREPPLFWSIYFPPHHYYAQGPYTLKRFPMS